MKYVLTCLTVALFVFGVSYADAQDMYIGAAGGYAFQMFDQDAVWTSLGADPDEVKGSFAGQVFFGYGVSETLDIEASLGWYLKFVPDESALEDYELKLFGLLVSAKYKFGMDSEWCPYIIGGVGWGKFSTEAPTGGTFQIPDQDEVLDTEQTGLFARVGGGIEYPFSDSMTLLADVGYNFTFGDIEDWNFTDFRMGVRVTF